jgi:phosphoenolpyruvate carboxykinase (ATP)
MPIKATRAMLHAALEGQLADAVYRTDPVFGFQVPREVPGVDTTLLDPRATWADPGQYDRKARELAAMFVANFERFDADDSIRRAGPSL